MGYCGACFQDSSPIQPTIQKSVFANWYAFRPNRLMFAARRVLLASIKSLGRCPCPRCFVEKENIGTLGTMVDRQRRNNIRKDSEARQSMIARVRGWIFEQGRSLTGPVLKRALGSTSSVPTVVGSLQPFSSIFVLTAS
jgi:hypothetical protein